MVDSFINQLQVRILIVGRSIHELVSQFLGILVTSIEAALDLYTELREVNR